MNGLNFTKKELDALGAPLVGRRDYYHDSKVRGLALAVYPTGRKVFVLYRKIRADIGVCPKWSSDRQGGVGIMQITPFRDVNDLWNWRTNVNGGISIFASKIAPARAFPAQVAGDEDFLALVDRYNQTRMANNQPPITVVVPPFTEGDFGTDDIRELELDTIRGYNGYCCATGQFGLLWHEFRVQLTLDGDLDLNVDEQTLTGRTRWQRIPVSERPPSGDPNYVEKVTGLDPTCGSGQAPACQ
jgi:hypothetical protein